MTPRGQHSRRPRAPRLFADVRFGSESDCLLRRRKVTRCAISDKSAPQQNGSLFDHVVGAGEQCGWNVYTKRLSGLDIDDQLEPGRPNHG